MKTKSYKKRVRQSNVTMRGTLREILENVADWASIQFKSLQKMLKKWAAE